ncbi:MAG: hypothetical protein JRI55_03385 [Deltaproteobacteria bacterium]|jgi:hypothetical protein|nr:hypothetical protein [Deltaproteobacteria bacterium]
MPASRPALRLARRLTALPEPVMRERVFLEYLRGTEPSEAAAVMQEVCLLGREGGPPFNIALLTVASTLSRGEVSYELQARLYEAAKEAGLDDVMELLLSSQPSEVVFTRREEQLELTLGHRKWMARSTDRNVLDRLLAAPEPEVVQYLLENPRITEQDVVLLAARRPAYPEIQYEIFTSRRWIRRYNVKRALVLNPYTPTDLSLRLLRFLNRSDLRLLKTSPNLPQALRNTARRALEQDEGQD